jgi:hypothetical protein
MERSKPDPDRAFESIRQALSGAWGEDGAITINDLALMSGLYQVESGADGRPERVPRRREAERILELRFQDFGFLVISGDRGYYRPTDQAQIDHWWASLHSSIRAIATRMHTGRLAACRDGWRYLGAGRFQRAVPKDDLFGQ